MRCPADPDVDLVTTERQGVVIDHCPACRGVWLDRGALDTILDRAATQDAAPAPAPALPTGHAAGHVSGEGGHGAGYEGIGTNGPRERAPRTVREGSWLGDLLDFG